MQCIALVAPMLPGKIEVDRSAMLSCRQGERKPEYESSRERHGISREAVWVANSGVATS